MVATFIAAKGTYCAGASTLVLLGGRLTRCHGHISRAPLRCVGFPVAVLVQAKGERRKANVAAAFGARRGRGSRAEAAGFFDGLIVDNFAGGGGASLGLELGLGRAVDIAVNHDAAAIAMHSANHPRTLHLCEDVWAVDPVEVCAGRAVDVAWFSPDCKHFSRAKGGKPVEKKIRGLAWVAVKWARLVRPRVIFLENVREFADWGPLGVDSRPCRERKGRTFRRFVSSLRNMGYVVEWRNLNAADYGAPTNRRRLFLIARCDGSSIVWPEVTHGNQCDGRREGARPVQVRGDVRDGVLLRQGQYGANGRSEVVGPECGFGAEGTGSAVARGGEVFAVTRKPYRTAAECIDWSIPCPSIFDRKRPLAEKTLRRIAMGLRRYVLENPRPFIIKANPGSADPGFLAPTLVSGYGEREGQEPRASSVERPLGAAVGSSKHALVSAFLAKHYGGVVGHGVDRPVGTVTMVDHHSVVAAALVRTGQQSSPGGVGAADAPLSTVVSKAEHCVVSATLAAHLTQFRGSNAGNGGELGAPLPALTAQGTHVGLVAAFLAKYYGNDEHGAGVDAPMHTVTAKDRIGVVKAKLDVRELANGERGVVVRVEGVEYVIADIGLRMLSPRELARAQGFPDEYVLTGSKASQVARIGNSVCPVMAEVLSRANCGGMRKECVA